MLLDHGAHGAIDDKNAFIQQISDIFHISLLFIKSIIKKLITGAEQIKRWETYRGVSWRLLVQFDFAG